jgi:peptidyl-prolyl cis-trans isomerase SurA
MLQSIVHRRSLTSLAALLTAALAATAVLGVAAWAQAPVKAQKSTTQKAPTPSAAEPETTTPVKGSQSIVVIVNDEPPITVWEIEQRAGLLAANTAPDPSAMKAKAEARWAALMKDPKTNERFQVYMRDKGVASKEQAQAAQMEFIKKLQQEMIEQLKREVRSGGVTAQLRKRAQEELIDERLKVQEAKKLGFELSDDDAFKLLQGIADRNKMSLAQFAQHVKAGGFDISTLRDKVRAEHLWREAIRRRFGGQISINQKEIDRMLSAAAAETGEDTFELQVQKITLPVQGRTDQTAFVRRLSQAQALHNKFDGCKGLPALTKDVADAKVEDLKYVRPSNVPEPTRGLLLVAKDGDMLPPAAVANGVEMYAVCGRRPVKGDDTKREKAAQELQSQEIEIVAKKRLFDLRQEAHIEYR